MQVHIWVRQKKKVAEIVVLEDTSVFQLVISKPEGQPGPIEDVPAHATENESVVANDFFS